VRMAILATTPPLDMGLEVGALLLGIVFLTSGIVKIRNLRLVALSMVDFGYSHATSGTALLVAISELSLAGALAAGAVRSISLAAGVGVLCLFTAVIARALQAGRRFPCMCFGDAQDTLSRATLFRTAGLLAMTIVLLLLNLTRSVVRPGEAELVMAGVIAVGSFAGTVLLTLIPRLLRVNPVHLVADGAS